MQETWKVIPGYNSRYYVSNFGLVKSFASGQPRILAVALRKGYPSVTLCGPAGRKLFTVHRLVAIEFLSTEKGKDQVNHIDGIKTNNRVDNLEWCDCSWNAKHAYRIGLRISPKVSLKGDRNGCYMGPTIATCIKTGKTIRMIGKAGVMAEGFEYRNVSACVNGRRKSHHGHTFHREPV